MKGCICRIPGVKRYQTMNGKMKRLTNQHPFQWFQFLKFCCSYHQSDEVWLSYSIGSFRYLLTIFHMQHSIFPGCVLLSQESWDPIGSPSQNNDLFNSKLKNNLTSLIYGNLQSCMRNRATTNKMWNSNSCNHTHVLIISRFCFFLRREFINKDWGNK